MTISNSDISEEPSSAPPTSEAALLRLTDFVKRLSETKSKTQIAENFKTLKVIAIYERKLEPPLLQQKGLQLDKAA